MKFEKETESGIGRYMKTRACTREIAIADLLDVGIGRVAALDKFSSRPETATKPRVKRRKAA